MIREIFVKNMKQKVLALTFMLIYNEHERRDKVKERVTNILKSLLFNRQAITLQQLSEKYAVSIRTIQNDLNEIDDFLIENQLPSLVKRKKIGISLELTKNETEEIKFVLENVMQKNYFTREDRLLDLVLAFSLNESPVFVYQKEDELKVSKSTIDEDMRILRSNTEKYEVEFISTADQGMIVFGKEKLIRSMLYDCISHSLKVFNFETSLDLENTREKILFRYLPKNFFLQIEKIYHQSGFKIDDINYRNQMFLYLGIWIKRMEQGFLISDQEMEEEEYIPQKIDTFVSALFLEFHLRKTKEEETYIRFIINSYQNFSMNSYINWASIQLLALKLIYHVERQTGIQFSQKENYLHEKLYQHMIGLIERLKNKLQVANPLTEEIKQNYPLIYSSVSSFSEEINYFSEQPISDDELAFLTIHFSAALSEMNQRKKRYYKAIVLCNHGSATGRLLTENLKEKFNIDIIATLSTAEIDILEKLDADLIFSTIPFEYEKKPLLIIDPIINENNKNDVQNFLNKHKQFERTIVTSNDSEKLFVELLTVLKKNNITIDEKLFHQIERVFDKNHINLNKKEIQPMIQDILKDEEILLNMKVGKWQEAIEKVSKPLELAKIITPNYTTAMIQSIEEYGPYIVIGKNLALAHARPEDGVNRLGLSVATIEGGINFGNEANDPVKIIFCLAATDSYSHLNIMKELISLINNFPKLEKLIQAKEKQEFKDILFSN